MLISFKPELDNPPKEPDTTVGFSLIGTPAEGTQTRFVQIRGGLNRDIDAETWDKLLHFGEIQRLMKLGALTVVEESPTVTPTQELPQTLADLHLGEALDVLAGCFDVALLQAWEAQDQRIRVKNAINRRLNQIKEGNG
jgi:hypothetical protein